MNVLKYLYQLPQNLIGLLVIAFTKAQKQKKCGIVFYHTNYSMFGVSLGNYIIIGGSVVENTVKHEYGHQFQSLYLGWLYLLVVGLPSVARNIWDRIAHRKWSYKKRSEWYFGGYPENWADKLGTVRRRLNR